MSTIAPLRVQTRMRFVGSRPAVSSLRFCLESSDILKSVYVRSMLLLIYLISCLVHCRMFGNIVLSIDKIFLILTKHSASECFI